MNLHPLNCVGMDAAPRKFWWESVHDQIDPSHITFRVHESNPPTRDAWFEMNLEQCPNGVYKITEIANHGHPHYSKMGIGDALIPEASRVLEAAIRSSSNKHPEKLNESRNTEADKIWERLRAIGLARYCSVRDYYIYDPGNHVDACTQNR